MNILDDLGKIKTLDTEDMLGVEENFYNQLLEAQKIAADVDISMIKGKKFKGIAILGMGGSGFSGDIIKSLVIDEIGIPIEVVKSYTLPEFVNKEWLVMPVSYSGNTEETISSTQEALKRKCELLCVTSGGKIEEIAKKYKKCLIMVPPGYQPRGASGYLFLSTFLVLGKIDIIKIDKNDLSEALDIVKKKSDQYKRNVKSDSNKAKILAAGIGNKLPIVYGTNGILSSVAFRWKCEFNENSKAPSFWSEFPELNHNETVGWERLKEISSNFVLIVFIDEKASDKIRTRIKTTLKLIKGNFYKIIEIPVEGNSKLAKALSTIYLGDIASVYLALLNGINPTPVDKISVLKAELAKLDK
jgi:glucose/mannose-6-phosphate isomerase